MQNGPADQADLADFIARGNKPDLVALLRHAGERLPSGSDTAADHRVVLLLYLRRAPGHLILALESLRAGDDVAEGALYGDSVRAERLEELASRFPFAGGDGSVRSSPSSSASGTSPGGSRDSFGAGTMLVGRLRKPGHLDRSSEKLISLLGPPAPP